MKIIINADDFGLSEGVNYGIIDTYRYGILTSTTALVNGYAIGHAVKLAHENKGLGIGIHFTLTFRKPLSRNFPYVDENGNFLKHHELQEINRSLEEDVIYEEFKVQLEKFVELFGFYPDHIDSHHHVHEFPIVKSVVLRIAKELNVPVRGVEVPVELDFYDTNVTESYILESIDKYKKIVEIMTHPAYVDNILYSNSSYSIPRIREVEVLKSHQLKVNLDKLGHRLVTFNG